MSCENMTNLFVGGVFRPKPMFFCTFPQFAKKESEKLLLHKNRPTTFGCAATPEGVEDFFNRLDVIKLLCRPIAASFYTPLTSIDSLSV